MIALECGHNQLIVDQAGRVAHLGARLPLRHIPNYQPQVSRARTEQPSWPEALPLAGNGWFGVPGLAVHCRGDNAQPRPSSVRVEVADGCLAIHFYDAVIDLHWSQHWHALGDSGVFRVHSEVLPSQDTQLNYLASVAIPVVHASDVLFCAGGWTREGQLHRQTLQVGGWHQTSRVGRSGHDHYPAFYVNQPGRSMVLSLAWSGDHESHVDVLAEGQRLAQIGEHLAVPLALSAGQRHQSPPALVSVGPSEQAAQHDLHQALRAHWLPVDVAQPRDVHLNSWEAVYFDHNLPGLAALAAAGERAGAERFVLDDGWFGSRRNDESGLGDWTISSEVWPEGFTPLVKVLAQHGQNFGLWVEPEMVNPVSQLAARHPEWMLHDARYPPIQGRQQLMLDLGLDAVQNALFTALDAVLSAYPIRYLKWDHNRLAGQPRSQGRYGTRAAVLGVYALFERLRAAHPDVQIESCASGGGRMDLGVLRHCYRVWTSDCNDPIERALMQPAMIKFLPPEVLGSHAGPADSHTTSRVTALKTRIISALQGSYGYEFNLASLDEAQLALLAEGAQWYKANRLWMQCCESFVLTEPAAPRQLLMKRSACGSHMALWVIQVRAEPGGVAPPARLPLDGEWRLNTVMDSDLHGFSRAYTAPPSFSGEVLSGAWLAAQGLNLVTLLPEQALLIEGTRV
ncbi:hypothetical protein GH975_11370 [Litorivicinus lipolyticus]|uniref:alpha-galactosidase n=1 Tax=Litorivicinus lipolyticus TaxID=418701 RepID=A0A5Q2QH12_9GAMM|nr:alpha-galactosidase [Litorivicinus lipolyticus]QGG81130.1 hypothetical protein GH975_11370 [Litorivicinus lipolyticus]